MHSFFLILRPYESAFRLVLSRRYLYSGGRNGFPELEESGPVVQKKPAPQADVPVVEHEGLVRREGPGREVDSYGEGISVSSA